MPNQSITMAKDSEKKSKSSKSSKKDLGSVGYFSGDCLKTGNAVIFWSENKDPKDEWQEKRDVYGNFVKCKYVVCENAEKVFEKFQEHEKMQEALNRGNIYNMYDQTITDILKEVSEQKIAHTHKEKKDDSDKKKSAKKGKKEESDDDTKKKSSKKGKKDSDSEEDTKKKSSKKSKKDDSDEESEEDTKKKSKGKKAKKDESEDEASSEEDTKKKSKKADEKPKKKSSKSSH
jgi:hypothetical protein